MKILKREELLKSVIPFVIALSFCLSICHITNRYINYMINGIVLAFTFFTFFKYFSQRKYSVFSISFLIYIIVLFISSFLNDLATPELIIKSYLRIATCVLFFDMLSDNIVPTQRIIRVWYYAFAFTTIINFITILLYPNGMYRDSIYTTNWFLGYDNMHICFFLATIALMFVHKYINSRKMNLFDYMLLIVIIFQVYYCFSANSVVAITIFIFYYIFKKFVDSKKVFNVKNYFLIYIFFNIMFVFFRIQEKFAWLIVNILNKNLNFTGRTYIWDRVIELIKEKPILGYGKENIAVISNKLGNTAFAHAHNTILDAWYKGGTIGMICFVSLLIIPAKKLYENKNNVLAKNLSLIFFLFLLLMLFEARQENFGLYMLLILAFKINTFIKVGEKNEQS